MMLSNKTTTLIDYEWMYNILELKSYTLLVSAMHVILIHFRWTNLDTVEFS